MEHAEETDEVGGSVGELEGGLEVHAEEGG